MKSTVLLERKINYLNLTNIELQSTSLHRVSQPFPQGTQGLPAVCIHDGLRIPEIRTTLKKLINKKQTEN